MQYSVLVSSQHHKIYLPRSIIAFETLDFQLDKLVKDSQEKCRSLFTYILIK